MPVLGACAGVCVPVCAGVEWWHLSVHFPGNRKLNRHTASQAAHFPALGPRQVDWLLLSQISIPLRTLQPQYSWSNFQSFSHHLGWSHKTPPSVFPLALTTWLCLCGEPSDQPELSPRSFPRKQREGSRTFRPDFQNPE